MCSGAHDDWALEYIKSNCFTRIDQNLSMGDFIPFNTCLSVTVADDDAEQVPRNNVINWRKFNRYSEGGSSLNRVATIHFITHRFGHRLTTLHMERYFQLGGCCIIMRPLRRNYRIKFRGELATRTRSVIMRWNS